MGRAKVSSDKKTEIKALVQQGFTQRYIAEELGVSKTCVLGVAQKLKQNLPLSNLPGQGRKKASTATDDRNLLRLCKKGRTKSSQELSSELLLSNGKQLSARTIRRRLLDLGYKSYTAKRKPYRKPAQQRKRLSFARQHQHWLKEWNNIIWSDEAHFEVLNRKNRTFVRRLKHECNEPFNFVPRVQGGGGSVSVWGCIAGGARGPLVMYSGNVNGAAYIKIIEEPLPMFIENAFDSSNNEWAFMHDNAPPHRSAYTMKWLKDHNINVFKWPATSPDLNPIESLWDHIDKELRKMKPTNVTQLQNMIQDIWHGVTSMRCQKLVDSMPNRIKQCIKSCGGTFQKY
jgi:transposase